MTNPIFHVNKKTKQIRAIFEHKNCKSILVALPAPFHSSSKFNIIWRGLTTIDELRVFIQDALSIENIYIGSLYFFSSERLSLPPYQMSPDQFDFEEMIIDKYGEPKFVRHKIFSNYRPNNSVSSSLEECDFSVWSSTASSDDKETKSAPKSEIGVFTSSDYLGSNNGNNLFSAIRYFLHRTISPSMELPDVENYLMQIGNIARGHCNEQGS